MIWPPVLGSNLPVMCTVPPAGTRDGETCIVMFGAAVADPAATSTTVSTATIIMTCLRMSSPSRPYARPSAAMGTPAFS
jgi:hypothetical protein